MIPHGSWDTQETKNTGKKRVWSPGALLSWNIWKIIQLVTMSVEGSQSRGIKCPSRCYFQEHVLVVCVREMSDILRTTFFHLCGRHCLDPSFANFHGFVFSSKWLKQLEVYCLSSITSFIFNLAYFYISQHSCFVPFGLAIFKSYSASSKKLLATLWAKLSHN